jgi:ribosome-binding protein aMBF1 (putative translation factor)
MPVSDVSTFVRTLTTELKKDPDAGARLAREVIKEWAKASYDTAATVKADPAHEKELQVRFGRRIADLRKSMEISGNELARRALISQAYVCRIEKGTCDPSLTVLRKIAKVLGMKVSALLDLYDE